MASLPLLVALALAVLFAAVFAFGFIKVVTRERTGAGPLALMSMALFAVALAYAAAFHTSSTANVSSVASFATTAPTR